MSNEGQYDLGSDLFGIFKATHCAECRGQCAEQMCIEKGRMHRYADPPRGETTFRYLLGRRWGAEVCPKALVISTNPSTASAFEDDRTILKDIELISRAGYGAFEKANLFALRATKPKKLVEDGCLTGGAMTDAILIKAITQAAVIIVAWGAPPSFGGKKTKKIFDERIAEVIGLIGNREMMCFGLTQEGYPRHPLYLANETKLEPYEHKQK